MTSSTKGTYTMTVKEFKMWLKENNIADDASILVDGCNCTVDGSTGKFLAPLSEEHLHTSPGIGICEKIVTIRTVTKHK